MNKWMCDNWQEKRFGDVISTLVFESFVTSIPSKTEKSKRMD